MRDEWFPHIAFPISWEQFHELPKSPIYKWEYWDGQAHLTARPKAYHCLLDLTPREVPERILVHHHDEFRIRPLRSDDWSMLPKYFAIAFSRIAPFCGMQDDQAIAAAVESLEKTRTGGEGPLIDGTCFVVTGAEDDEPCGAALVTLVRKFDLSSLEPMHWKEPPAEAIARRLGRPHLTWIFVPPMMTRFGIGSALLAHAVNALLALGYQELASTFLLGNESSTLWHWINGFRVVSWPGSYRAMDRHRERWEDKKNRLDKPTD